MSLSRNRPECNDGSGEGDLDPYVSWLQRQPEPLFHGGGNAWRIYFGRVAIPASLRPKPIQLSAHEARQLLRETGAGLARWFSRTSAEPTPYWYVVCDRYDFDASPRKVRNQIRKARRECSIKGLDAEWMARNAYGCYVSAFARYKHGHPISSSYFARIQRSCAGGPFHFYGAFVGDQLAGFAKCAVMEDYVALASLRLDPAHSHSLPSYALLDTVLRKYVADERKTLGNGFLSLHDETNMQDFLLKFGFRRVYCDLQVAYRPALGVAVNALYPFRSLLDRLPSRPPITAIKSLLRQEHIRRSCQLSAETAAAGRSLLSAN
jgi:hypothetical protein